ncbi:hypothetical protein A3L12_01090 [Thermococcus sp. P6]|nr:hypothetical protein A3L12_01090 [Thermococcus sp. P6]
MDYLSVGYRAGLDGVYNEIEPPGYVEGNVYKMDEKKKEELGIESLPSSLGEALKELKKDSVVKLKGAIRETDFCDLLPSFYRPLVFLSIVRFLYPRFDGCLNEKRESRTDA